MPRIQFRNVLRIPCSTFRNIIHTARSAVRGRFSRLAPRLSWRGRIEFAPARWLAAMPGLAVGLFAARLAYELEPARWAALVFWPLGPALALGAAAAVTLLYRLVPPGARILSLLLPWMLLLLYVFEPAVNLLKALVLLAGAAALSWMYAARALGARDGLMRGGARVALLAFVLVLYLSTMGRTVGKADTFEFQVVAPVLGVAHPTGYPLYLLLGKLFSLLPWGQPAWRVNLASVACAALAAALLFGVIRKIIVNNTVRRDGEFYAWAAALSLAASPVFWSQAIVAEVYALNAAFVALLLWLVLYGLERRQREAEWNARRWLFALALVYGLSLTNHLTMVLLAPALFLAVWWTRPRVSPVDWAKAVGLFALGLSVYLYILLRWPAMNGGQMMPLALFVDWVTGRQFGGALQPQIWNDPVRWRILGRLLLEAYGPLGTGLAAAGAASLGWRGLRARHERRIAVMLLLAFVVYCAYALIYNVPDISVFLIPAHMLMALGLGAGLAQISEFVFQIAARRQITNDWGILNLVYVLLPLSLIWTNLPRVDQSRAGQSLVEWGRYVLSLPLPRQAAILADSEKIAPLYYLKSIEGVRSDVDMIVMGAEELYRAELDRRVAEGQPVYLARFLPGLAGVYHLYSTGPLARVTTTPRLALPLAPITRRMDVSFISAGQPWTAINLLGYDLTADLSGAHHLTLYWQAQAPPAANYHVRLRLVSEAGLAWWQDPGTHPVGGYNPTAAWQPGEVVSDYHEIPAGDWPPGRYRLQVGWFLPFRDEGLQVHGADGAAWYDVAQLELEQAEPDVLPVALRANFGGQVLLRGASDPGVIPPGGRGQVELEWERLAPAGDYRLQMTLARADGVPVNVVQVKPFAGEYLVPQWDMGRRVQMRVSFAAPDQPGEYTLRLGWVDAWNRWVIARCGWMHSAAYECPVTTLRVEGAPRETGVNLADQVILVKSQIVNNTARPGEPVQVNLRWQGLKVWPADYTVFVHLVGPDGKLHGQVDAYPVQGTLPTTQWKAGQIVDDPYTVMLPPDAPPGEYQVQVGWYLLATLRRLAVLDAAGRPVDDHVIIGKVTVAP